MDQAVRTVSPKFYQRVRFCQHHLPTGLKHVTLAEEYLAAEKAKGSEKS